MKSSKGLPSVEEHAARAAASTTPRAVPVANFLDVIAKSHPQLIEFIVHAGMGEGVRSEPATDVVWDTKVSGCAASVGSNSIGIEPSGSSCASCL